MLAYRAIADLVRGGGGEAPLHRFCEQVGRGEAWRTAFEDAYGISVENFYAHFERTRSQEAPSSLPCPQSQKHSGRRRSQ